MTPSQNITLNVVATALLAEGVATLHGNVWIALAEIVLGILAYAVYELVPTKE